MSVNEHQSRSHCQADPAKAAQRRSLRRLGSISHNVYYVQADPGVAGTALAGSPTPTLAWSLIVRVERCELGAACAATCSN